MARARTHPWLDLFPPFFAFTNFDAGDMFESVGLRNLRGERRSVRRGKVSSSGVASSSSATKKKDKSETAAVRVIASSSEFRPSRRASRAYLASRVFFPMDFGYSVGIMLASLCASAVGDSARGICCSGDSWDMARDAIVTFRGCDEGFRRTRGGHEKRAPGWGPRRLADTPLESGDAREAKACATEAHHVGLGQLVEGVKGGGPVAALDARAQANHYIAKFALRGLVHRRVVYCGVQGS